MHRTFRRRQGLQARRARFLVSSNFVGSEGIAKELSGRIICCWANYSASTITSFRSAEDGETDVMGDGLSWRSFDREGRSLGIFYRVASRVTYFTEHDTKVLW